MVVMVVVVVGVVVVGGGGGGGGGGCYQCASGWLLTDREGRLQWITSATPEPGDISLPPSTNQETL